MKAMVWFGLSAVMSLAWPAASSQGTGCRTVVRRSFVSKPVVVHPVVQKVVKDVVVADKVLVPLKSNLHSYGAYYQPNQSNVQLEKLTLQIENLRLQNQLLLEKFQNLQRTPGAGGPNQPQVPLPAQTGIEALFDKRCGRCHEATVAQQKGGSFTLLNGSRLAPLTDLQVMGVSALTYAGEMPKSVRLTDEEQSTVEAWELSEYRKRRGR